jgi:hypothetical protein
MCVFMSMQHTVSARNPTSRIVCLQLVISLPYKHRHVAAKEKEKMHTCSKIGSPQGEVVQQNSE